MCLTPVVRNYCFFGFSPLTPLIVATAPLSLLYIANATPRNTTGHGRGEVLILLMTGTERYVFSSSSLWRQQ